MEQMDIVHNRSVHLQTSLARDPSLLESSDAVGGSIIHIAYLFGNFSIARFLVQSSKKLLIQISIT